MLKTAAIVLLTLSPVYTQASGRFNHRSKDPYSI
jgi:hypothetical protein